MMSMNENGTVIVYISHFSIMASSIVAKVTSFNVEGGGGVATGHMTWDTSNVIPGDYSVQVVVEDAFTGIRVSQTERERERERESHVICFVSRDGYRLASTPLCLTVVVIELDLSYEVRE